MVDLRLRASAPGRPRPAARLRWGLLLCGALLIGGTAARGARLLAARPGTAVVVRAVEAPALDQALLVARDGDAWTLRPVGGDQRRVRAGQAVELGGARVRILDGLGSGDEVLRLPWSVFGPVRGGHQRIDFGADPLGRADGVRDRIVLPEGPDGPAWFRLEPPVEGRPFGPEDRSARLVAERGGLRVRSAAGEEAPTAGDSVAVDGSFEVEADGLRLAIGWDGVRRAAVLEGADGRVVGYGEARDGVDFVVSTLGDRRGGARLVLLDEAGQPTDTVPLADGAPTLVHGPRTRITGFGGSVLPAELRDLRLEAAVRDGLREGWIEVGATTARVDVPREGDDPRSDLGWDLARDVVAVVDAFDRAAHPLGVRLLDGVDASASTADGAALRFEGALQAWVPSSRPRRGEPVTFELAAEGGEVRVAVALPARWRRRGEERWTALPLSRGGAWATSVLEADGAARIELELAPPSEGPATDELSVAVAGAPEGTHLVATDVRIGARAYPGWEQPGQGGPARELWRRIPGDRWSAVGPAPTPAPSPRLVWIRAPIEAAVGGWVALDVAVPGRVLRAWWNGEPTDGLPTDPGGGRVRASLRSRAGDNLLALEIELPGAAPARPQGPVRFLADADGAPLALDASVARRRMRETVRRERREELGPRAGAPDLIVERGVPGLPDGTRWRLAPGPDVPADSVLVLADGPGALRRNDFGALHLEAGGLAWHNGDRLALGAVRPLASDPEGVSVAGQRVAPGQKQALDRTGEAVEGLAFTVRALPPADRVVRGELIVVAGGELRAVDASGEPRWHRDREDGDAAGVRLVVHADGADVQLAVDRPATLWTRRGERIDLPPATLDAADVPDLMTSWPPGARLVVDGLALRLRRPGGREPRRLPDWAQASGERSTVDPDLQDAARDALRSQLVEIPEDTEALAGVLLVMNARSGDVLACASEERPGADERSRLPRPCWQDGGFHPGSTFKVATAAAGLGSDDPLVRAMLDGDLPPALRRDGPRGSLRGAKLPAADGKEERTLRSRLQNFHGQAMPVDTDLESALRSSMNTWFGYLGLLMHRPTREGWPAAALATAPQRDDAWPVDRIARAVGFGAPIDLGGGEQGTGGHLPAVPPGSDAPLAARAVGQDAITATPLGVAGLLALAAADGIVPLPRIDRDRAPAARAVLTPPQARRLRDALLDVVRRGTAARAFADNPRRDRILGKTGSAQRVDRSGLPRTDAWFAAAVLPPEGSEEDPVVVVALLPGAGLGGSRAAEAVDQFSRDLAAARGW